MASTRFTSEYDLAINFAQSRRRGANKQGIRTVTRLQDLVNNILLAKIIGIEGIDNLRAHQLGVEGLLAGGVNHLLLHSAVVGRPTQSRQSAAEYQVMNRRSA